MNDKALEDLQVKVAFLEDALSKLSDEFYCQQRDLENLKAQQSAIIQKINTTSSDDSGPAEISDERPPHY